MSSFYVVCMFAEQSFFAHKETGPESHYKKSRTFLKMVKFRETELEKTGYLMKVH